jgi:hypothetical protein
MLRIYYFYENNIMAISAPAKKKMKLLNLCFGLEVFTTPERITYT